MTENNYIQWSYSVHLFVCGKGKFEYLNKTAVAPPKTNPAAYKSWEIENSTIMTWLINSMTLGMGANFMLYEIVAQIWEATKKSYSNIDNEPEILNIEGLICGLCQGECY